MLPYQSSEQGPLVPTPAFSAGSSRAHGPRKQMYFLKHSLITCICFSCSLLILFSQYWKIQQNFCSSNTLEPSCKQFQISSSNVFEGMAVKRDKYVLLQCCLLAHTSSVFRTTMLCCWQKDFFPCQLLLPTPTKEVPCKDTTVKSILLIGSDEVNPTCLSLPP